MWAQDRHIGLLNWLAVPVWIAGIATFLLMDYAYWWWHWANHMVPLFWRFHNVHHTDLDLDVSTAARFHFGEMIFSIGFLSVAVTVFGDRADNAGRVLHHIRGCDALSSFQLASADKGRTNFESDHRDAADARDSSFDRAARDQFKLGHDFLLVGQTTSHVAPRCAAGRHYRSALPLIARNTNSHLGNSSRCRFVSSARGDCRTARFRSASLNRRKTRRVGKAVLYRLSHGLSEVALVQNVLARPQVRLRGIVADVANAPGKVLFVAHESIKIIALPQRTVVSRQPVDAHRRLSFPGMHDFLQRPLVHWREQGMHMVRHNNERDDVNARSVEVSQRGRDLLCARMAAQNARAMTRVEPLFDPS